MYTNGTMLEGTAQAATKRFSLFELLLVIAVLGLLSTIAIIAIGNARQKARDAARLEDMREVEVALQLYFNDRNRYPEAKEAVVLGQGNFDCLAEGGWAAGGCESIYLSDAPSNPTPNGAPYKYTSDGSSYRVEFELETAVGDRSVGPHSLTPEGIK